MVRQFLIYFFLILFTLGCRLDSNEITSHLNGVSNQDPSENTPPSGETIPPPVNPTIFQAKAVGPNKIKLYWESSNDVQISYLKGSLAPANCETGNVISSQEYSNNSVILDNVASNTQYSFRICGSNGQTLSEGTTQSLQNDYNVSFTFDANKELENLPHVALNSSEVIFTGYNESTGFELYKTDGTTTELLKDIYEGPTSSDIKKFIPFKDKVYFQATNKDYGSELWVTDGTTSGSYMLKDIHTGLKGSNILFLGALANEIVFLADDGIHGSEIWKTDGTSGGTTLVKDLIEGDNGLEIYTNNIKVTSDSHILFYEWSTSSIIRTDGTAAGTSILVATNFLLEFQSWGDDIIFSSYDFQTWKGVEPFYYDASENTTTLLSDIRVGSSGSYPTGFFEFNGEMFFAAQLSWSSQKLFKTNGTPGGTVLVKDVWTGGSANIGGFFKYGTKFYFFAYGASNSLNLWESDGTADNTTLFKNLGTNLQFSSQNLGVIELNSKIYFLMDEYKGNSKSTSLWEFDGTSLGTKKSLDLNSSGYDEIKNPVVVGSNLYFYGFDGVNRGLFKSDGTLVGTSFINTNTQFKTKMGIDGYKLLTSLGQKFVITSSLDRRIHITDGTEAGTIQLNNLFYWENSGTIYREEFDPFIFEASTSDGGSGTLVNLYKSDGTQSGTAFYHNAGSSSENHDFNQTFKFKGEMWYKGQSGGYVDSFWKNSLSGGSPQLQTNWTLAELRKFDENNLFVWGNNTSGPGTEIYKTDGTNFTLVKDINPTGNSYVSNREIKLINSKFYFTATDGVNGAEPWVTDLTTDGTVPLGDLVAGSTGGYYKYFNAIGSQVYFIGQSILYKTDGTENSATPVYSLWKSVSDMMVYNNLLYIAAETDELGVELWVSDGTTEGTHLLKDIEPGAGSSNPKLYEVINNELYFKATTSQYGTELWKTDGTKAFTEIFKDFCLGTCSGFDKIYSGHNPNFSVIIADDGLHGKEMWRLNY